MLRLNSRKYLEPKKAVKETENGAYIQKPQRLWADAPFSGPQLLF
jgi:hypothetical protein